MSSNVGNSPSRGHYSSKYVCPEHGCIQFYKTDTTNIKLQINPNTAIMMTLILHCSPTFPTFPLLPSPHLSPSLSLCRSVSASISLQQALVMQSRLSLNWKRSGPAGSTFQFGHCLPNGILLKCLPPGPPS